MLQCNNYAALHCISRRDQTAHRPARSTPRCATRQDVRMAIGAGPAEDPSRTRRRGRPHPYRERGPGRAPPRRPRYSTGLPRERVRGLRHAVCLRGRGVLPGLVLPPRMAHDVAGRPDRRRRSRRRQRPKPAARLRHPASGRKLATGWSPSGGSRRRGRRGRFRPARSPGRRRCGCGAARGPRNSRRGRPGAACSGCPTS